MKRARKANGKNENDDKFIEALQFIAVAQKKEGEFYQKHCKLNNGILSAYNGSYEVGCKVDNPMQACPNTHMLIKALSVAGSNLQITQLDSDTISIKSGRFKSMVPCLPFSSIADASPDQACAIISDDLLSALSLVVDCAASGDSRPFVNTVLLQAQTVVASNGHIISEAFHGIDLPPGILLPKDSVKALLKIKKSVTKFGFSNTSATFYFNDDSYFKTQLINDNYFNYRLLFDEWEVYKFKELDKDFYEAINALYDLADSTLIIQNGFIKTELDNKKASSFEINLDENILAGFNKDYIKMLEDKISHFAFSKDNTKLFFHKDNVRGILMGVRIANVQSNATVNNNDNFDDDIPF